VEKFSTWGTPGIRIEGVDVWHLPVYITIMMMKLPVCSSIYTFIGSLRRSTGVPKALLPFPPFVSEFPSTILIEFTVHKYMQNGQLLCSTPTD